MLLHVHFELLEQQTPCHYCHVVSSVQYQNIWPNINTLIKHASIHLGE